MAGRLLSSLYTYISVVIEIIFPAATDIKKKKFPRSIDKEPARRNKESVTILPPVKASIFENIVFSLNIMFVLTNNNPEKPKSKNRASNKPIIIIPDKETPAEKLVKVTYDNGVTVYVNYNDTSVTVDGKELVAKSYLLVE